MIYRIEPHPFEIETDANPEEDPQTFINDMFIQNRLMPKQKPYISDDG